MNGVVFQTSAMMITAMALQWPPNQALSMPSAGFDEAGVGREGELPRERGRPP